MCRFTYICNMKNLGLLEKIIVVFLTLTVIFGLFMYYTNAEFFATLVAEDNFYENLTSLFLFLTSFTLFYKFFKYQKYYGITWKIGVLLMAVAMFFGGGEEISWGQRIFNVESSDLFLNNNAQQETNLHNMVVGDVKLNKLIFSNIMSICFGIYFLVLPPLWTKVSSLKSLIDSFGISVARNIHLILFIAATILILGLVDHDRKWEMWEYVFALIMFLIVWNPRNSKEIFSEK